MGCTQSKIDQDEAITRCKERKHYLASAVSARNAFAAAHSAYAVSLKNTGAALSDYTHAEIPLSSSSSSSNHASSSAVNLHSVVPNSMPIPPPMDSLPPPPPPLPVDMTPLQRSVSMPDIPLPQAPKKPLAEPAIREEEGEEADDEEEEDDDEDEEEEEEEEETLSKSRNHRRHQPLRRSEPISTVTITASPPRPPPAIPVQLQPTKPIEPSIPSADLNPPINEGGWDFFIFGHNSMNPPTLSQPEETPWQESPKPVLIEEEKIEKPSSPPPKVMPEVVEMPVEPPSKLPKQVKKAKPSTVSSSGSNSGGGVSGHHQHTVSAGAGPMPVPADSSKRGRVVTGPGPTISPSNLLKAIDFLDDNFLKAYESAGDVSKMLEAARMHYHSNFAGSRGHINHSDKIMRVITWNRSFKGLPPQDDTDDKIETDEPETHATILDKLLAWDKKLYEEVKAGEVMKIEYQRKVALLNKQKKKGVRPEVLEKTKAAVSHLHTRYIVDMQSMDSTVSEVSRLRDGLLYPKLIELVNGMARMWRSMHDHHRQQLKIIFEIRAPYEIPLPPRETTEEHYTQTSQLHRTVKELHVQLQKLIDHQKDYVKNLNEWVRLSLIPIESSLKEKVSSPPRPQETPIKYLLHAWNDFIGKLPVELARNAILSFSEVVNTILVLQNDELTAKRRCEHTFRELDKRRRQFEDWYRKYMERKAPLAEESGADVGENKTQDPIAERRIQVEQLDIRLREEQENHRRLCKQVREKSIASLRNHLPQLFQALYEFAKAASEMYRSLSSIAQSRVEVLD